MRGYTVYECSTGRRLIPITAIIMNKQEAIDKSLAYIKKMEEANGKGIAELIQDFINKTMDGKPLNKTGKQLQQPKQRRLS